MKAIAFSKNLPADHPEALQDITLADPVPGERDLLVEVRAISVNPVDVKIRANRKPKDGQPEVIGWDAAGVVRAVGAKASLFKPGDRVWYAGALNRPGANSELHVVDERIVGRMPASLDYAQAAALPLTTITAWELLFDRLRVLDNSAPSQGSLLVIGAAGGVGSILVQLARQLTGLTVIGTASRPETQAWVRELGAHHVIDHSQPLAAELKRIGFPHVSHIAGLTQTDQHFAQMAEAIAPQGKIALIDDPAAIDVRLLKSKSASLHWEFMFARSLHATPDLIAQHELLNQAARLIDEGTLRTTLGAHYGKINAENLRRAHAFIESGKAQGKIVLEGF
ncbi:zinc-binding alcohol dehydrogenase family protein [Achromobacter insolitus]|uniref:Zinc-type alcohol dehydrogenase-like protein n=1 Tax=Achromobacter insolitus TaxID=217204 RepID=A0A6S7FC99_9BURK|nr:zinc-binding alcohol dehydrogenase family protein [Achromobacter insolitus]CAB3933769.1 Zinc-type alcohol dehydrogenase-like protein [Achromobacter insolitus]CAB3937613.1 Zinc-type alcohol dehydrogenase-like protein [Achromobacter insolitus]